MNRFALAALALVTVSAAVWSSHAATPQAEPASYLFNGAVRVGQAQPMAFGQRVLPGQAVRIEVGPELILEFNTPTSDTQPSLVRLLQGKDAQTKVLHEARTLARANVTRSMAYRVCGASVTFITPAPAVVPACS
jgi:hypothetical protein